MVFPRSILIALLAAATLSHASVWTQVGPYHATPAALAFVPGAPNTLVVSAAKAVLRSTDGGNTFNPVAGQPGFNAFAAGGPGSSVIYGFGSASVSKTVDGGQSWQVVNSTQANYGPLVAVAPSNSQVIYTAVQGGGGVNRSTNGGASFSAWSTNLQALPVLSLAVSPANENVVYAGTLGPLFKSTDGGQTFIQIGPTGKFGVRAVAIDPGNSSTLFCVLSDGVYKSTDSGTSFVKLGVAIPAGSSSTVANASIAIDPSDSRSVYVAVSAQLWHSSDGGASWNSLGILPGGASDVRIQPGNSTLFVLGDQLYRSSDGGVTWSTVALGLSDVLISGLASNPLAPDRIFAVGSTGEFLSVDRGQHFLPMTALPVGSSAGRQILATDPSRPQITYFIIGGGLSGAPKLLRSQDGGSTWVSMYAPVAAQERPAESFDAFAASQTAGVLNIISSAYGGGVFRATYLHRSVDDGVSWTITPIKTGDGTPVQNAQLLLADPQTPRVLYLAAGGFLRSVDGGATWALGGSPFAVVSSAEASFAASSVKALAQLPTVPVTLLASSGVGVYRSVDGGATWTPSSSGLSAAAVVQLSVDPLDVNSVYAATDSAGIYHSVDAGYTWSAFNTGLDAMETFSVLASGGSVIAGTRSGARRCADHQCAGGAAQQKGVAVEFYNTLLNHYFMTADAAEVAGIDAGSAGPGWVRTNATFNAWPTAADAPYNASQVYRFYGTPKIGPNSHFYTISSAEFANVLHDRGWTYEYGNWFWVIAPTAPGQCPVNTTLVYRAYNDRFAFNDSNHRYTASLAVLQSMVSQGWIAEGVVMCMPQ